MARKKKQSKEEREREIYRYLIKNQAQRINARYKALEKAGLEGSSQSYKTVEHYAVSDPRGKGKNYAIDYAKGSVRVSGDTRKMSLEEMKAYSEQLGRILSHKTGTVTGTKKALEKAYETAKQQYQFEGTQEQYNRVWQTYKDNVEPDKRQKIDSEIVMAIMEYSDIYKMSEDDINAAMSYINRAEDKDDALLSIQQIQDAIEIMESHDPEEAAELFEAYDYTEFISMFPNKFSSLREFF